MKIGLALAGGGSLGAYQVGILKYLKEKNQGSRAAFWRKGSRENRPHAR